MADPEYMINHFEFKSMKLEIVPLTSLILITHPDERSPPICFINPQAAQAQQNNSREDKWFYVEFVVLYSGLINHRTITLDKVLKITKPLNL